MEEKQKKARVRKIVSALKKLFPHAGMMLRFRNHWELLVAVMLSAQCTDKKVNEVTGTLFTKYRTLDDYVHASPRVFEKDIYQTGFYRAKTKNILASARMVKTRFGGTVPKTLDEIMVLPGVARKTANVVLGIAYGVSEGIAVDTHVIRLARVLGLTENRNPNRIEQDLMHIVPRKEWMNITYLLIEYGRNYCPARKHRHDQCSLNNIR